MHYNKIRRMDISNGPGVRVSIFVQGCDAHCPECFNPETWDYNNGKEFTQETIDRIISISDNPNIVGLSVLGGEPLNERNILGVTKLVKQFKQSYPHKNIWVWTGLLYEDIKDKEIIHYIDVLVDGRYQCDLHDFRLKYRGSSNQRVIDVRESIATNSIVLYSKE